MSLVFFILLTFFDLQTICLLASLREIAGETLYFGLSRLLDYIIVQSKFSNVNTDLIN